MATETYYDSFDVLIYTIVHDSLDLMEIGKCLVKAILAGMFISIGGTVYLTYSDYRFIGALLFSVGLFGILSYDLNLYTGKICYIFENGKKYFESIFLIIFGNLIGCIIMGLLFPIDAAIPLCEAKLDLDLLPTFAKGFGCGIMMFLAVDIYKTRKSYLGVFLCVPTFILAGFEHSIADMFYFASAGMFSVDVVVFLLVVLLGNAIGGFLIPLSKKYTDGKEEPTSE